MIGHYEASEARKVALCENKEKNGTNYIKKVNEIKESKKTKNFS